MAEVEVAQVQDAEDLYPKTPEDHAELVDWCLEAFKAADSHRTSYYTKWQKFYKLYRSYIEKRKGDWRSTVFVPYIFSTIEAIMPRMVASLPKIGVEPVEEQDVEAAKGLERLMEYSANATDLDLELIKLYKQALKYGTGLGKTYYERRTVKIRGPEKPAAQEVPATNADGSPMMDINDKPMMMPQDPMPETGDTSERVIYEGPRSQWVDIFNFWVAPEAADLESARYTIERVFREVSYIKKLIDKGVYRLPPGMTLDDIVNPKDEPADTRRQAIGETAATDSTRKAAEIWEIWTDDNRCITMMNRMAIIRVIENPYDHGMKPYFRTVDYLNEGEFWGMGEIESLEGLQDLENALVNQRIDNVRMTMDQMMAVNVDNLEDLRDLRPRPGGVIRTTGDRDPREIVMALDTGDVTNSAFKEAEQIERLIERVSGVSAYQMGIDTPSQADTATGMTTIVEQGNTKFALKVTIAEILGIRTMARQWGSLLQQYSSAERFIRVLGPTGEYTFDSIQPDSLLGAVDYNVQIGASAHSSSAEKELSMTLLQVMAGLTPQAVPELSKDVLIAFGKKNLSAYLGQQAQQAGLEQSQMQQAMSPGAPAQGMPPGQEMAAPGPAAPPVQAPGQAPPGAPSPEEIAQLAQMLGVPVPTTPEELDALLQMAQQAQGQQAAPAAPAPAGPSPQASFQYQMRPQV